MPSNGSTPLSPARLKRVCEQSHARTRAAQRYGLDMTYEDVERVSAMIRSGTEDVVWLRPDNENSGRYYVAIKIEDEWLPVVYDEGTRTVVTFLPATAIDQYRAFLETVRIVKADAPKRSTKADKKAKTDPVAKPNPVASPDPDLPADATWDAGQGIVSRVVQMCIQRSCNHYEIARFQASRKNVAEVAEHLRESPCGRCNAVTTRGRKAKDRGIKLATRYKEYAAARRFGWILPRDMPQVFAAFAALDGAASIHLERAEDGLWRAIVDSESWHVTAIGIDPLDAMTEALRDFSTRWAAMSG